MKYIVVLVVFALMNACSFEKETAKNQLKKMRGLPIQYFGKLDKGIIKATVYYENQPIENKLFFVKDSLFLDTTGFMLKDITLAGLAFHELDKNGYHQLFLQNINFSGAYASKLKIDKLTVRTLPHEIAEDNRSIKEETRIMDSLLKSMDLESH